METRLRRIKKPNFVSLFQSRNLLHYPWTTHNSLSLTSTSVPVAFYLIAFNPRVWRPTLRRLMSPQSSS